MASGCHIRVKHQGTYYSDWHKGQSVFTIRSVTTGQNTVDVILVFMGWEFAFLAKDQALKLRRKTE